MPRRRAVVGRVFRSDKATRLSAASWFDRRCKASSEDARCCRAPHHEGSRPHPEEARNAVSKDAGHDSFHVIASAAKQSIAPQVEAWIASLRPQCRLWLKRNLATET